MIVTIAKLNYLSPIWLTHNQKYPKEQCMPRKIVHSGNVPIYYNAFFMVPLQWRKLLLFSECSIDTFDSSYYACQNFFKIQMFNHTLNLKSKKKTFTVFRMQLHANVNKFKLHVQTVYHDWSIFFQTKYNIS